MRNAPAYKQRAHSGLQNFGAKTFTDSSETAKNVKVFPLKVFCYMVTKYNCYDNYNLAQTGGLAHCFFEQICYDKHNLCKQVC